MSRRTTATLTFLLACLATAGVSVADEEGKKKVDTLELDISIPESPAFTVLGVNPQTIERPLTARRFATSFLNGFDPKGNLQSGIAVDVGLGNFVAKTWTINDYRSSAVKRILMNTQFSVGTAQAGKDSPEEALRAAASIRTTLWDQNDPRRKELAEGLEACFAAIPFPSFDRAKMTTEDLEAANKALSKAVQQCRTEKAMTKWNGGGSPRPTPRPHPARGPGTGRSSTPRPGRRRV